MLKPALKIIGGMVAIALALELILHFLPVKYELDRVTSEPPDPIVTAKPNSSYFYSEGWNLRAPQKGRVNASGFAANTEYDKNRDNIAIVGDSYVESTMTKPGLRYHELLNARSTLGVYGFGRSGADVGEYMAMAQWVVRQWHPKVILFNLIETDVSNASVGGRGDHLLKAKDGQCVLEATERKDANIINTIKKSNLLRYFIYNLDVTQWYIKTFIKSGPTQPTKASDSSGQLAQQRTISQCFLDQIGGYASLPKNRIIFVIDAHRSNLYKGVANQTRDIDVLATMAEQEGFPVIRLDGFFKAAYDSTHLRADMSPRDWHWSEAGQALVANAVCAYNSHANIHPGLCAR
ncbi:MAG: hypothetical protein V4532_14590 [Pseudomonadota bacterium]